MSGSIINLAFFNSGQSTVTRYCICYWRCNRLGQRQRTSMGISEEKLGTTSGEIWRRIFIVSTCEGKLYISLEKISCSFIFFFILSACFRYICDHDRMVVGFTNYVCNQCLSQLTWIRILLRQCYSIQHYVIKSDLRQVGGFLRYSGFLHQ